MCGCLSCAPHWIPGLQSRLVLWLGIEPVTLWFADPCSIHWATPVRAPVSFFRKYLFCLCFWKIFPLHIERFSSHTLKGLLHSRLVSIVPDKKSAIILTFFPSVSLFPLDALTIILSRLLGIWLLFVLGEFLFVSCAWSLLSFLNLGFHQTWKFLVIVSSKDLSAPPLPSELPAVCAWGCLNFFRSLPVLC